MEIWTLWHPTYWLSGLLKAITAFVSVLTAVELVSLIPKVLALPSPAQLQAANVALTNESTLRQGVESALRQAHNELELRVEHKTKELQVTNQRLQEELAKGRQSQSVLQKSEQRYRFLADAMPQIVWTALSNGYLDYYNKRWYEFTGFVEGEGGDKSWMPILHPEDIEMCLNRWYSSVRTGEPYEIEYRFIDCKTNTYRWHLGRALPMFNQAGEIVMWVGTCTDIHDYKEAQKTLLEAHERLELKIQERTSKLQEEIAERIKAEAELQALFAAMTDIVIVRDAQGRCLKIPPTKPKNLYKSAAEMIGKTLHETLPRPEADTILGYIRQALNTQKTVCGEYSLTIEQQEVCYSANFSPISSDSVLLVARDITERKQVESEMRKAKESAEAANRAKSEFLANMSHEIRTPMNGVIGMTGLLLNTNLAPQQRDFVETIRCGGDALLTIINDILDFSKIEAGKLELETHPFDLRRCVESALDLLAPQAAAKNLDLGYLMNPQTPSWIVGDSTRLSQILVNLLSNAVKFTQSGEVVVSVTAQRRRAGGAGGGGGAGERKEQPVYEIQFAVKDTGIGIPTERMERLFKPFSQVDSSTTRQYGGTGLGLAISSRLSDIKSGCMTII